MADPWLNSWDRKTLSSTVSAVSRFRERDGHAADLHPIPIPVPLPVAETKQILADGKHKWRETNGATYRCPLCDRAYHNVDALRSHCWSPRHRDGAEFLEVVEVLRRQVSELTAAIVRANLK